MILVLILTLTKTMVILAMIMLISIIMVMKSITIDHSNGKITIYEREGLKEEKKTGREFSHAKIPECWRMDTHQWPVLYATSWWDCGGMKFKMRGMDQFA